MANETRRCNRKKVTDRDEVRLNLGDRPMWTFQLFRCDALHTLAIDQEFKAFSFECFSEDIRQLIIGVNKVELNNLVFNLLFDEVVANNNVFRHGVLIRSSDSVTNLEDCSDESSNSSVSRKTILRDEVIIRGSNEPYLEPDIDLEIQEEINDIPDHQDSW
nr:hypothetical protein [Tanacetum cinerariifolium]